MKELGAHREDGSRVSRSTGRSRVVAVVGGGNSARVRSSPWLSLDKEPRAVGLCARGLPGLATGCGSVVGDALYAVALRRSPDDRRVAHHSTRNRDGSGRVPRSRDDRAAVVVLAKRPWTQQSGGTSPAGERSAPSTRSMRARGAVVRGSSAASATSVARHRCRSRVTCEHVGRLVSRTNSLRCALGDCVGGMLSHRSRPRCDRRSSRLVGDANQHACLACHVVRFVYDGWPSRGRACAADAGLGAGRSPPGRRADDRTAVDELRIPRARFALLGAGHGVARCERQRARGSRRRCRKFSARDGGRRSRVHSRQHESIESPAQPRSVALSEGRDSLLALSQRWCFRLPERHARSCRAGRSACSCPVCGACDRAIGSRRNRPETFGSNDVERTADCTQAARPRDEPPSFARRSRGAATASAEPTHAP